MKKIFVGIVCFLVFGCGICSASIQATGQGTTERAALHSAMRSAIEQELGAHLNSKILVQNSQLINMEIATDSEGFISSYEIISKRIENGVYVVEILAEVNSSAVETRLMTKLQKKAIVENNSDSPRVAVVTYDSRGNSYREVENEILTAMKKEGFNRTIDLSQLDKSVKKRIANAEDDAELRNTLANDFHVDYLVQVEVKISQGSLFNKSQKNIALVSRLISVNTGEIIYGGTALGYEEMFLANSEAYALKRAAKQAGTEIAKAALNYSAKIERHITLLVTKKTFDKLGGTLTAARETFIRISGVNDLFLRQMSGSLEFDVNFDGTASDFAQEIERLGFKIQEINIDFIKI